MNWINSFNRRVGIIYAIRCAANGKYYIGSTRNHRRRHGHHWASLRSGKHSNPHMQAAWRAHGESAFSFHVLAVVEPNRDGLLAMETHMLKRGFASKEPLFNARAVALGPPANVNIGRTLWNKGKPFAAEARSRMSESARNRLSNPPRSADACARISAALAGRTTTAEARKNMSASARLRRSPVRSMETREKIAASLRGRKFSDDRRAKCGAKLKGRPWSEARRAAHEKKVTHAI